MNFLSNFIHTSGILENSKIEEDFGRLLLEEEEIEVGFRINEDTFIFTNKRLIFIDVKKGDESGVEYSFLPYSGIASFSVLSKKSFDANATLRIWVKGQKYPKVEKEFNKSVDVYEVQKVLTSHVVK